MTRTELVRRLAEHATRPLSEHARLAASAVATPTGATDLFVWFEDTSERRRDGRRGIAGLPESLLPYAPGTRVADRKSTRLNSSHLVISYAVFCLKKKKEET